MSLVRADAVQLGSSATATQNFVLKTNKDGTGGLYRGNSGAESATILEWDSGGRLKATVPAFAVYHSAAQALVAATFTKIVSMTEEFDVGACYDTSAQRFIAPAKGVYHFDAAMEMASTTAVGCHLYKNGVASKRGWTTSGTQAQISCQMELLAGDYVELWGYAGASGNTSPGSNTTFFAGHLVTRT
jgi:hypothetical protein